MKKTISLLLVLLLTLGLFAACNQGGNDQAGNNKADGNNTADATDTTDLVEENDVLLPCGLEFGMTNVKVHEILYKYDEEFQTMKLEENEYDTGYYCDLDMLIWSDDFDCAFLHSNTLASIWKELPTMTKFPYDKIKVALNFDENKILYGISFIILDVLEPSLLEKISDEIRSFLDQRFSEPEKTVTSVTTNWKYESDHYIVNVKINKDHFLEYDFETKKGVTIHETDSNW